MRPIAVLSHIVTDEVYDPDGKRIASTVGGAGAYAAVGASMVTATDRVVLVAGMGARDADRLRSWLAARGVSAAGVFEHGDHSPVTEIRYLMDGERVETPRYGLEHFEALAPYPRHAQGLDPSAAYFFTGLDPAFWAELDILRTGSAGPIVWELHAHACRPDLLDAVLARAALVGVLSLNATEARQLLGGKPPSQIFALVDDACVVALRLGANGALIGRGGRVWSIGVAPTAALDPTGGGNSWTGAFTAGLADTGDPIAAAQLAAAAAAEVVSAIGAPVVDESLRARVRQAAGRVAVSEIALERRKTQ